MKTKPNTMNKMQGQYKCPELNNVPARPGAMDAFKYPSRQSNELVYRDGRKEKL